MFKFQDQRKRPRSAGPTEGVDEREALLGTLEDFDEPPPLVLADRARLHNSDRIAFIRLVLFVVGHVLRRSLQIFPVHGMLHLASNRDGDGLVHFCALNHPDALLPVIALSRGVGIFVRVLHCNIDFARQYGSEELQPETRPPRLHVAFRSEWSLGVQ